MATNGKTSTSDTMTSRAPVRNLAQLAGTQNSVKPTAKLHVANAYRGGNNSDKFNGSHPVLSLNPAVISSIRKSPVGVVPPVVMRHLKKKGK